MAKAKHTALHIHEAFAINLAFKNNILWDAYTPDQFPIFKQKLDELFRDPEPETKSLVEYKENAARPSSEKNKAMEKVRKAVYESTIAQTKYTNKNLLAAFILVTVAEGTTYAEARNATKFSVHLVVRTRKCIKKDDSTDCCMAFIDEHGRVYKNWKDFIETNLLPPGVAYAPVNGVYTYEADGTTLNMDSWETPANGLGQKITGGADTVAAVGGFGAAAVTVSALALPVAAPVLAGAGIVCLGTGVYSAIRSGWQLWSRNEHEQSISLADQSARSCWFGVASGAVAVSASAANKWLASLAMAGKEITLVHETVVNGMNITTMLLSGTGVANGIVDILLKYSDDEEVTTLDVLQVAASLVIFTHSVYNFRLASTIVSQTQDARLNTYRSELSNRQRKMFEKMSKETIRTQGAAKGKTDLIRLINEVPDKQYLNDLHKINKDLNKNNARFTAGRDGNIVINDDVAVKPGVLRDSVQHGKGENILGKVNKPIPQNHETISNSQTVNSLTTNAFSDSSEKLINYCQTAFNFCAGLVLNRDSFQNCVQYLIEHVGEEITHFLLSKAKLFIEEFGEFVETLIKTHLYLDTVLWDLYKECKQHLETITLRTLHDHLKEIFEFLLSHYKSMSHENPEAKKILCTICQGFYQITTIT